MQSFVGDWGLTGRHTVNGCGEDQSAHRRNSSVWGAEVTWATEEPHVEPETGRPCRQCEARGTDASLTAAASRGAEA
jgi:hypothetical protein